MARKPTLYCLLAQSPALEPTGGDKINEARFLRGVAKHFDVYYNNRLYDPEVGVFGDPGGAIEPPNRDYDLYYVRSNTEILQQCGHPRVTMAVPYDPEAFAATDGLLVTTRAWKDLLERRNTDEAAREALAEWYGRAEEIELKPIFFMGQALDPSFRTPSPRRVLTYRHMFTNGQAFGYFGRIAPATMPSIAMAGIAAAAVFRPEIQFVYGGFVRKPVKEIIGLQVPVIDYADMPAAVSACAAILGNEEQDSDFLGSGKIIDAMVAGTPVLAKLNAVRLEQLGPDYPLYYRNKHEAAQRVMDLIEGGSAFRAEVRDMMQARLSAFEPEVVGRRLFEAWETLSTMPARRAKTKKSATPQRSRRRPSKNRA